MRTQIQLPESDLNRLREVAKQLNRSVSDCIREGISMFLADAPGPKPDDFADLVGKFRPIPPEEPNSLDTWLAEAILRSKRGDEAE